MPDESLFLCPHCGQPVDLSACPADQSALCPHCAGEFSLPEEPPPDDRADELDGHKIRQLATLRRAAYRSRSYAIIAASAAAIITLQLALMTLRELHSAGLSPAALGYLLLIPAALWAAWHFTTRAIALHREARHSTLSDPQTTPDFSPLSDGSHQARNLEKLR